MRDAPAAAAARIKSTVPWTLTRFIFARSTTQRR